MSASNYLENALLNYSLGGGTSSFASPAVVTVSLHSADTSETGLNEITGGSYARQAASSAFGTTTVSSSGQRSNSVALTWTNMPTVTVAYAGIWDSGTSAGASNNFLYGGSLTASKSTTSGDTFTFTVGSLIVTMD